MCRQKYTNNRAVKRLTKEETKDRSGTSSESEESIHHGKEIKKTEEKSKHYTATVKINVTKKEFIIDTGSPIRVMPPDGNIKSNRNTKNHKQIPRRESKRSKFPLKDSGRKGIREYFSKTGNSNH